MLSSFSKLQEECQGIETDYIKILTYDLPKGHKDHYKSYAYNRICTILDGQKEVRINGKEQFSYSSDEFVLLKPHSTVEMNMTKDTTCVVYEISDSLIDNVQRGLESAYGEDISIPVDFFCNDLSIDLMSSMNRIQSAIEFNNGKEFMIDLYAQEMVYKLIHEKHLNTKGIRSYNPVDLAVQMMKQSGNESITIQEIAKSMHMTSANLAYLFRQEVNMSPKQYQNILRIKKAKSLLLTNNVTEVATKVGFDNISYFIKLFKTFYGVTPKQFIKG